MQIKQRARSLINHVINPLDIFFNRPQSAKKIAIFRISLGIIYLWNQLLLIGHLSAFYSDIGYFTGAFMQARTNPIVAGWNQPGDFSLLYYGAENATVYFLYWLHIAALGAFIIGFRTRWASAIVWIVSLSLHKRYPFIATGEDTLPRVFFFFCMFFDTGLAYVPNWIKKISNQIINQPFWPIRAIQFQIALGYFFSAVFKLTHSHQWLSGTHNFAMLNFPLKSYHDFLWLSEYPLLVSGFTYWVLLAELSFVFLVWQKHIRKFVVANMILFHLGIFFTLNAFTFSPLMIASLLIFLSDEEHQKVRYFFFSLYQTFFGKAATVLLGMWILWSCGVVILPAFFKNQSETSAAIDSQNDFKKDGDSISCPTGYIPVPAYKAAGITQPFCVMKYEAKQSVTQCGSFYCAESVAHGKPWVGINRHQAENTCRQSGGHLVTDKEWVAIAQSIAKTPINDVAADDDIQFATGHSDNRPSAALESDLLQEPVIRECDLSKGLYAPKNNYRENMCELRGNLTHAKGYVHTDGNWTDSEPYRAGKSKKSQLRTLVLSNGEVIWDFAGNVWEWTDLVLKEPKTGSGERQTIDSDGITGNDLPIPNLPQYVIRDGWIDYLMINDYRKNPYLNPHKRLSRVNGLGGLFLNPGLSWGRDDHGNARNNSEVHNSIRGGYWEDGSGAGIFALALTDDPSNQASDIGFRCATAAVN